MSRTQNPGANESAEQTAAGQVAFVIPWDYGAIGDGAAVGTAAVVRFRR
jgi:hypothetical protein